jgi:hypothetical protein
MTRNPIPDPADAPKPPLDPGIKIFFGVILPHCGLAVVAFLFSRSFGPGEAGGFAALGFVVAASTVGAVSFVLDLCLIGFISFVERTSAFLIGCIIPFISLLLLVGGRH